ELEREPPPVRVADDDDRSTRLARLRAHDGGLESLERRLEIVERRVAIDAVGIGDRDVCSVRLEDAEVDGASGPRVARGTSAAGGTSTRGTCTARGTCAAVARVSRRDAVTKAA